MRVQKIGLAVLGMLCAVGCSAIKVEKLDTNNPDGVPFFLTKPIVKVTTTTYKFIDISAGATRTPFATSTTVEKEVVNVIDPAAAYTINQTRSIAGESTFKLGFANAGVTSVETSNKEGLTEFLKGLVEGTKTLTELAKEGAGAAAKPAGAVSDAESGYFQQLAQKNIAVVKTVDVTFEALP